MLFKKPLIAICFSLVSFTALAQDAKQEENKDTFSLAPVTNPAVVATYPLTEEFLAKMEIVQKEMADLPPEPAAPNTGNDNSIDGLTASVAGRPKLTELLKKNGLEPKDYVIGYLALQASLAAAASLEDKDAIFDESTTVSKENLEFGQKNTDRIRKLLESTL